MTEQRKRSGPKPGTVYKSKPGPKARVSPPASKEARDTGTHSAIGQKITDAKPVGRRPYPDEIVAAARSLWEGDPLATHAQVAKEVGLRAATVTAWSKKYGWGKRKTELSERAQKAVHTYKSNLAEHGTEITTAQKSQAEENTVDEIMLELRANLTKKHRKEWDAIRNLLYKGMTEAKSAKGFDASKFAKISAETLKIIHESERRSWGIDSGPAGEQKVTVIIERE